MRLGNLAYDKQSKAETRPAALANLRADFVATKFCADSKQNRLRSQPDAPQQVCVAWVVPKGLQREKNINEYQ